MSNYDDWRNSGSQWGTRAWEWIKRLAFFVAGAITAMWAGLQGLFQ